MSPSFFRQLLTFYGLLKTGEREKKREIIALVTAFYRTTFIAFHNQIFNVFSVPLALINTYREHH